MIVASHDAHLIAGHKDCISNREEVLASDLNPDLRRSVSTRWTKRKDK